MGELTFGEAATFFAELAHGSKGHQKEALGHAAKVVEDEIKSAIGTYKYGWPPLAPSTLLKKGADTPLLETGAYRESFTHSVISNEEAQVGSNDPKADWFESGTSKMPPRPVCAPAAIEKEAEVIKILETAMLGQLQLK